MLHAASCACNSRIDAARLYAIGEAVLHQIAAVPRSATSAQPLGGQRCDMAPAASDAVRVTLLKARTPILRLDVAPFAVIYALLHAHAWTSLAHGTISYETLGCIPVALALHLLLFLSTRWSVRIRCWVAFRTCDD